MQGCLTSEVWAFKQAFETVTPLKWTLFEIHRTFPTMWLTGKCVVEPILSIQNQLVGFAEVFLYHISVNNIVMTLGFLIPGHKSLKTITDFHIIIWNPQNCLFVAILQGPNALSGLTSCHSGQKFTYIHHCCDCKYNLELLIIQSICF